MCSRMIKYFALFLITCFTSSLGSLVFNGITSDVLIRDGADAWISTFDRNGDGSLNQNEFSSLCRVLFRNDKSGQQYTLTEFEQGEVFGIFDQNTNELIDMDEFAFCWDNWIKVILHPVNAFLVIDVQNDFITGTLDISIFPAKHNGKDVIKPINKLLDTVRFDSVYYSKDWHPRNHVSFIDNVFLRKVDSSSKVSAEDAKVYDTVVFAGPPKMAQKLWPRHCVQGTWGAELHKDLKVVANSTTIFKGLNPDVDSHSVFWDNNKLSETALQSYLKRINATDLYIVGLAYDVCVGASAFDAQSIGYRTILVDDCCRGVDPDGIKATKKSIIDNHGVIVDSDQVKDMVQGRDRRPELGYKLALPLKEKRKNYIKD